MSTLIGAVSLDRMRHYWLVLGNRELRWKEREETAALGGALLMEILAAAWHILNTHEFLKRALEEDVRPFIRRAWKLHAVSFANLRLRRT